MPKHLPVHLIPHLPAVEMAGSLDDTVSLIEIRAIQDALKRNHNNRSKAASDLGMHKSTLFRKIKKLGITLPSEDGRTSRTDT